MKSKYRTVKERSEGMYKEKGSKFIGIAVPCYNESEANDFLNDWKQEHHQARHLCYAYRFGMDTNTYRANDDGEPNNSAGAPILGQIDSFELTNTLIGVVRYYGGTKLGVGGLINAYRTAAKEALASATIVELEIYDWVQLNFGYEDMPQVMNFLKKSNLNPKNKRFESACSVVINLPLQTSQTMKSDLQSFDSMEIVELGRY